ncbi:MAG: hypothetical protein BECKG1743D_GA0114223_102143 [Candidatus Kentron sp. G]|nr:MAG: hypothetical protein BECKG1743E_GA0114224_102302 [Candidatus Kentron sp. G]VFN00646.1 MAG: hypothetical protein BECKG1743D_GA0114223_102143 [Candidatus Kentron sp. G]VFN02467.1 MAG: hypothetical protein BECKG1743F_GA0114225_106863 [Candidatus Kentron sp. G]
MTQTRNLDSEVIAYAVVKDLRKSRSRVILGGLFSSGKVKVMIEIQMLGAKKIIYAEIFDYAQGGEEVSGLDARRGFRYVAGVQIVYVSVDTGEKLSMGSGKSFGSSCGEATEKAIRKAVYEMVDRL